MNAAPAGAAGAASWLQTLPTDPPPRGSGGAAVLAVLRDGLEDVEVLLIQRAVRDGDPASGQVGLPGGHVEESDASLAETALRELEEEVGLTEGDLVTPLRCLGLVPAPRFALTVAAFAAELGPAGRAPRAHNAREVAHVFWLPVAALRTFRLLPRDTPQGSRDMECVVFDGHVLWGFTRRVLLELFKIEPAEAG